MNMNEHEKAADQLIVSLKKIKDEVEANNKKAEESFKKAYDLFDSDMSAKAVLIKKKRNELEKELAVLIDCEKSMKDMYSETITSGDKEETKRLEIEMKNILGDIAFCKSKIELIDQQRLKGEKKLFDDVCKAYKNQGRICSEGTSRITEARSLIGKSIEQLEDVKKDMQYIHSRILDYDMVKVYEMMNGPIMIENTVVTNPNSKVALVQNNVNHIS